MKFDFFFYFILFFIFIFNFNNLLNHYISKILYSNYVCYIIENNDYYIFGGKDDKK